MGILNITPDSFYDGGKYISDKKIIERAEQILSEGAKIIDIGAYSSRPGASHVPEKEELDRLQPVLSIIRKKFPEAIISVDTFRSNIAEIVVKDYEASIINDISGGNYDPEMFKTISELNVPYIIMHIKGIPENMQTNPQYEDLIKEILMFFAEKIEKAKLIGINDIIIDPGFGFGKTLEHNYELMKHLDKFKILDLPILVGISRKSMIYNLFNSTPDNALTGTIALNAFALQKGADILRVHDVKEAIETIKIVEMLN